MGQVPGMKSDLAHFEYGKRRNVQRFISIYNMQDFLYEGFYE